MITSQETSELDKAMCLTQGQVTHAIKDRKNKHLGNEYASIENTINAFRVIAAGNGLNIQQYAEREEIGYVLITRIAHTSGQFIWTKMPLILHKADMQGYGAAITYARRYALSCLFCIGSDEDNDCETAEGSFQNTKEQSKRCTPQQAAFLKNYFDSNEDKLHKTLDHYEVKSITELSLDIATKLINRIQEGSI